MIQFPISKHSPVTGDLVAVQIDWWKSFVIFPHKSITNNWIWGSCYKRIVWRYTGFIDEPFTEYGTLFDVLQSTEQVDE
jgi:hypothetical protein